MDKFLKNLWNIVKIIFMIFLILFGLKLIILLFSPPFYFMFGSPFGDFDWNPAATIFGAVVTGFIAWFAVDKTAKMDKKARIFESSYKYFQSKIVEIADILPTLQTLNDTYLENKNGDGTEITVEIIENNINKITKTITLCNQLLFFAKNKDEINKFITRLNDFKKRFKLIKDVLIAYNQSSNSEEMSNYPYFRQGYNNGMTIILHKTFIEKYKNPPIDLSESIKEMQNMIIKYLKLEEK